MSRWPIVLACLVIGGAALRAHDLERALVWHDEVFTQVFAAGHGSADWLPLFDGAVRPVTVLRAARENDRTRSVVDTALGLARDEPQHPPLYYVAARLFTQVAAALAPDASVTEAAARLRWLSYLFALVGFAAAFWCARELFEDRGRRLAAVALYAFSPFHVFYAQEAREYALWTVLVLASTAALLRARRLDTGRAWGLYALLLALGFYTSFAMATVALGHGLFVAARELPRLRRERTVARRAIGRPVLAWTAAGLLFAPWAFMLLRHWEAFRASMAWSRNIRIPASQVLDTFGLNLTRPFVELGADSVTEPWVAVVGVIVLAAGVAGALSLRRRPEALACLLGLFVAPLLLFLLPDLIRGGIRSLSTRYLIPSLLVLQLLVAALVPTGEERAPWLRRGAVAVLLLLGAATSVYAASSVTPWTKGISRRLPEIAAVIERHPGALLVADHERHHPGTMLTLSGMVPESTDVQLLGTVEDYELADHPGPIFLLDVSPRFRAELEASAGVRIEPILRSLHVSLWRVHD